MHDPKAKIHSKGYSSPDRNSTNQLELLSFALKYILYPLKFGNFKLVNLFILYTFAITKLDENNFLCRMVSFSSGLTTRYFSACGILQVLKIKLGPM